MKDYQPKSKKSKSTKKLINEALDILESVGVPIDGSERNLERMAVCFLAVAGIRKNWKQARNDLNLKTRDIIQVVNQNFEEKISPGSYDDIRRKALKLLVLANLVVNTGTGKGSATNDPTRGYSLDSEFAALIVNYRTSNWRKALKAFSKNRPNLADLLARKRDLNKVPVTLPDGSPLSFSLGKHNDLQKAVIEEFLPRFGAGAAVLYVGDTANKMLHIEREVLSNLGFFSLSHNELPDIVAYSEKRNWLYLIEAVYSSGPMSETRVMELKKLLKNCTADPIFVTAFLSRDAFKKWQMEIAWETEVWTADHPDHLIHFNGDKFLGPF